MDARGGEAHHGVAGLDPGAVDQPVTCDDSDARPGHVELILPVDARKLGGLATQDCAAGLAADLGHAFHELGDLRRVDPAGGHVVEQHQRVGTGREHVVDAVGGEVDAAPAQQSGTAGENELRADTVRGGNQEPLLVECVQPGKGAQCADHARRAGRVDGSAQALDDRVRSGERDP